MVPEFTHFEFDAHKEQVNTEKHGVSFRQAEGIFSDPNRFSFQDERKDYGEARWIELGQVDGIVLVVVWTQRETKCRIISARKANSREVKRYEGIKVSRAGP